MTMRGLCVIIRPKTNRNPGLPEFFLTPCPARLIDLRYGYRQGSVISRNGLFRGRVRRRTQLNIKKRSSMLRGFGTYNLIGLICGVIIFGVVSMSNAEDKSSIVQPPTVAEAEAFIRNAEAKLLELSVDAARADWVKATYITDHTGPEE